MFVGAFDRHLDDKSRLALPVSFRAHLGERCYLSMGSGKCIAVIPEDEFERIATETMAAVKRGETTMQHQRALAASASMVTIDRQGRVKLDQPLRDYAGITDDAPLKVAGNLDRVEIWDPQRYAAVRLAGEQDLAGNDVVPAGAPA